MTLNKYHHGDLRSALLGLAEHEIEIVGHEALELKTLAEKAGVSRSAPYRHFRDRDEFLISLTMRGFELLRDRNAIAAQLTGDAVDRLRATCVALVDFAADHPQMYRMMFGSDIMRRLYSIELSGREAVGAGYAMFENAVAETMSGAPYAAVRTESLACLAALHGFIMLKSFARLEYLLVDDETEDSLLEKILRAHLSHKPCPCRP